MALLYERSDQYLQTHKTDMFHHKAAVIYNIISYPDLAAMLGYFSVVASISRPASVLEDR